MNHNVTLFTFEDCAHETMSHDKYITISNAYNFFNHCLSFEECFGILIENYIEFEVELLTQTAKLSFTGQSDFDTIFDSKLVANRRLTNLLSSCRMHIDQTNKFFYNVYTKSKATTQTIQNLFSTEYEARIGYRVMHELRNISQHESLPVQGLTFHSNNNLSTQKRSLLHLTSLHITTEFLKSTKCKQRIIQELEKLSSDIELKSFTREYISGLCSVHNSVRLMTKDIFASNENILVSMVQKLQEKNNITNEKSVFGLLLFTEDDEGHVISEQELFIDIIKEINRLRQKYREYGELANRVISSQVEI